MIDAGSVQNPCSPRVILASKDSCPILSLHTLWHFINSYYIVIGLLMISLGLFLMVLGGKYYRVTMFLAGQMSVCAFLMIILFLCVYPANSPYWVVWLSLFVTLGIGAGIGYAT